MPYNIDFSSFVLKCDQNDCSRNEDHRCCVACDSFQEYENALENCINLYLKHKHNK
ncbi:MAG TPA: hypothetical protein VIK72_13400 [Clostridiaceae bacterium]